MGLISFLKEKFGKKKDANNFTNGMKKSNEAFIKKMNKLSSKYKSINQDYFDDLEEILIESDVGVNLAVSTIDQLMDKAKKEGAKDVDSLNSLLVDILFENYSQNGYKAEEIKFKDEEPTVLLVVGTNGVGKTTSIAKLAYRYASQGKKTLLVAGDTFRAGATEQLNLWANRLNLQIVVGKENADPSSVVYDGIKKAREEKFDFVIVDTAGRLTTKNNLMMELAKIKRVISKDVPNGPQETFLIIDATTGQNGIAQATAFKEVTDISGIVLTKMDGTSKGGIILPIRDSLGIPVRFIGLGEKIEDLELFDLEKYLYGLCVGD